MTVSKFIPISFLMFILVAAPLFVACKDNKESTAEQTTEAVQEATLEDKKNALNNVVPANNANTNNSATGAVNPPHGQPGHRCDIAVGAPLNGAPAATPKVAPVQTNATPVKVADGMNPPHGQPGHRCDVKVGDPL